MLTWQWSRRWSLTPSTKRVSHRGPSLKGVAVQGMLFQIILNAKLTRRKKLGRTMCTSNRDDRKLENSVKQSRFKHLGVYTRSELKLESVHQESPRSDIFRKRTTKPLLKQKHHQKHLTWRCTSCFHQLTRFMEMLSSFSGRTLAPRHSQHVWPEAHLDSMGFFSRERWETVDPTIKMSWRPKSASAESQSDHFHATAHWCWSLC